MKKIIIALMGLFTLAACSEDTYQADLQTHEKDFVDNNSDGGIKPFTISAGYNSPFVPGSLNWGVRTTFTNNTPLLLELTPYGQDITVQTFLNSLLTTYPPLVDSNIFNAFEGNSFLVKPFAVETNADSGAPVGVNALPFSNSLGSIIYDFVIPSSNWRMFHFGKIYYFKYKIYNTMGIPFEEGYIRQQFYGETDTSADVNISDSDWIKVANADGLMPFHQADVMYHRTQDEMCITNKPGYSTPPLLSTIPITDPGTGNLHTLEFTSDASGIYVNFN